GLTLHHIIQMNSVMQGQALPLRYNENMRFITWLSKHQKNILAVAILLYIGVFSAVCLWKYSIFGYDGLDLAIFNNVFWNTANGDWFALSIHPHSFLGDHAGFGLLLLIPFYLLHRAPETLLILQTVALATAAWPIFLLAGSRKPEADGKNSVRQLMPLVIALAWLMNPLVQNINLFEFHLLPFALVPLLFMLLAYERRRLGWFMLLAMLAMLWREDVSLVVAGVGLVAMLEKRGHWWRILPIIFGAAWFLGATYLIARFAPNGQYKFSIYYSWLGDAPASIASHLLSLGNLEMLLGFGIPLVFLPYLSPKRLTLALGPFLQIVLSAPGGSAVVLNTHYAVLFLPALFWATIFFWQRRTTLVAGLSPLLLGLILVASLYGTIILGPLPKALDRIISGADTANAADAKKIIQLISNDAAVVASYTLLPHLSSRTDIFSAHYVFLGVEQFATGEYLLPTDLPLTLAFDARDLLTYRAQFLNTAWARPHYDGGRDRLAHIAGSVSANVGQYTLYAPRATSFETASPFDRPSIILAEPYNFSDGTAINGYDLKLASGRLNVQLELTLGAEPNEAKRWRITLANGQELVAPLINDLQQPKSAGSTYNYIISLPTDVTDQTIELELESFDGLLILDSIGSNIIWPTATNSYGTALLK
ncbi:MAG: DUF2079 domain-containing protein, partial [Patescibacteria group bacterium]